MAENERMRTTLHNGRKGKDGVYNPKHNDRNGYEAEHIDKELKDKNVIWLCDDDTGTIDEHELKIYEQLFSDSLNAKNANYKKHGNYKSIRSMEAYRMAPQSCPEETLIEIGNIDNCEVSSDELLKIYQELLEWQKKTYPQCKVLDYALHLDEPNAAPHIHERKVWVANRYDKDGNVKDHVVGQAKALQQMGVERPKPNKPSGRYNNAKQTFTEAVRNKFNQICQEHGYDIEMVPKEPSKTGLSLLEYQRQREEEKTKEAQEKRQKIEQEMLEFQEAARKAKAEAEENERKAAKSEEEWLEKEENKKELDQEIENLKGEKDEIRRGLTKITLSKRVYDRTQTDLKTTRDNNAILRAENEELKKKDEENQKKLEEQKTAYKKQLEEMNRQHQQQLNNIRNQHNKELSDINAELEQEKHKRKMLNTGYQNMYWFIANTLSPTNKGQSVLDDFEKFRKDGGRMPHKIISPALSHKNVSYPQFQSDYDDSYDGPEF